MRRFREHFISFYSQEVCKYLQTSLDGLDGSKIEPIFVLSSAIPKVPSCKIGALKPAVKQVSFFNLFASML